MATSLEQRNYIATETDIDHLAADMLGAQGLLDTVPRLYLRSVVATTIHELDAPQRVRAGKVEKIDEAEQARQHAALEKVLGLFYPRIVTKMSDHLPTGKGRAEELNRRTNWARSIHRDVRNWIRAGHDLRTLAPSRLIRAAIIVTPKPRAPSAGRLRSRVERTSKDLVAGVMELALVDKAAAIAELELLMGQLAGQMVELSGKPVSDARKAAEQHVPFRQKGSSVMFVPTQTQVIRQQERPS